MGIRQEDGVTFRTAVVLQESKRAVWSLQDLVDAVGTGANQSRCSGALSILRRLGAVAHVGRDAWKVTDQDSLMLYLMGTDYATGLINSAEHRPSVKAVAVLRRCTVCFEDEHTCRADGCGGVDR